MGVRLFAIRFFALLGVCWMLPASLAGQGVVAPDNEDILTRTIDIESPYYIDRLMAKYLVWEEPLTAEEMHYLYYGYAYSELYRPLEPIVAENRVLAVVDEIMKEPTEERMRRLVDAAMEVMERDPFSPRNLNLLAFAYGSLGEAENERKCFERMEAVLQAIETSGTGVKEDVPMHVLRFEHAADLLHAKGLEVKRREVVSRTCEYIFLTVKDERGNMGYYFDFSRIYWVKGDVATPKREERGWSINSIPLK